MEGTIIAKPCTYQLLIVTTYKRKASAHGKVFLTAHGDCYRDFTPWYLFSLGVKEEKPCQTNLQAFFNGNGGPAKCTKTINMQLKQNGFYQSNAYTCPCEVGAEGKCVWNPGNDAFIKCYKDSAANAALSPPPL